MMDMMRHVLDDRKTAKGKTGGVLSPETMEVWRVKLSHPVRLIGPDTPLAEVDYLAVGRFLDARAKERRHKGSTEAVSQHTIHKELAALRFGLRLEKQNESYPYDVDYVTRLRSFAVGYKPRRRHLTWEEIPLLLGGLLQENSQRVSVERIQLAKHYRHTGMSVKGIAVWMECAVSTVHRYLSLPYPEPTRGGDLRAKHAAWIIATGARRKESYRAELVDHDFEAWTVHIRGTKTGSAERTIPIAPPFRALLLFATAGRPEKGPLFPQWAKINRSLILACKRAGIERCSPNDLRRTHASLLRQAGIALEDLAPVLGHTSTRMLEAVYGRTNLESLGRAFAKLPERNLLPGKKES